MIKGLTKGFTLIELLVVITIIGILATGAVTTFTSQIQKARDTTRISDIKALESWVQQYYQDRSSYPSGLDDWTWTTETAVTDYVPTLAQDPKHDETCNGSRCGYIYNVWPDSVGITDGSFELSTAFENEGNRTWKASQASDNGEDDNRLEVWVLKTGTSDADLVTLQAQGDDIGTTAATDSSTRIAIIRSGVLAN